jgi:hypothetical protein
MTLNRGTRRAAGFLRSINASASSDPPPTDGSKSHAIFRNSHAQTYNRLYRLGDKPPSRHLYRPPCIDNSLLLYRLSTSCTSPFRYNHFVFECTASSPLYICVTVLERVSNLDEQAMISFEFETIRHLRTLQDDRRRILSIFYSREWEISCFAKVIDR